MSKYDFLDDVGVPRGIVRVSVKLLAWAVVLAMMALVLAMIVHMIVLTVGQTILEIQ